MFCIKCGSEIDGSTNFCPNCGTSQSVGVKEKKKLVAAPKVIVAIVCLCIIALAVTLIPKLVGSNINESPETLAVAFVKSSIGYDVDVLVQCYPDFMVRNHAEDLGLPANVTRQQLANAIETYYADEEIVSANVEIISSTVLGYGNLGNLLWDYYGMTRDDYNTVTRIAYVEVEYQEEGEFRVDTLEVTCIEIDKEWYILDAD